MGNCITDAVTRVINTTSRRPGRLPSPRSLQSTLTVGISGVVKSVAKALVGVLLLGFIGVSAPATATAADGWVLPAVDLSASGQDAFDPQVAVSGDGSRAISVWTRYDGNNAYVAQARVAVVAGGTATWGPVANLSDAATSAYNAHVAISSDGTRATAVWVRDVSNKYVVESASATISASTVTWGSVTSLSASGQDAAFPQVALSSDGTKATAVWLRYDGSNQRVQSASATIGGTTATWGPVSDLSPTGGDGGYPQVTLSSDGTKATAIWQLWASTGIVQTASATISGTSATWGAVSDLSDGVGNADYQHVALSSDGTKATAIWTYTDRTPTDPNLTEIVQSASATITGSTATWSNPTDLITPSQTTSYSQVALSADGTKATAVWTRRVDSSRFVQSTSATISGNTAEWATDKITSLSAANFLAYQPRIGLTADGSKAVASWYANGGTNMVVQSTTATVTSNLADWNVAGVVDLSDPTSSADVPQMAFSRNGATAVAIWQWQEYDPSSYYSIQAAVATYYVPTPAPTEPTSPSAPTGGISSTSSASSASPPGAPQAVSAAAGDGRATVSWSVPMESGSSPISHYSATSSPGGKSCTVTAPALTCDVTGLANGTAYTFTVKAYNDAGWGAESQSSAAVTPQSPTPSAAQPKGTPASLLITRVIRRDGPLVEVIGLATGLPGTRLTPWIRFAGETRFSKGTKGPVVDEAGAFTWSRKTSRKFSVYFTYESVRSNTRAVPARKTT